MKFLGEGPSQSSPREPEMLTQQRAPRRSAGALRLLGVAASGLKPEQAGQQSLFPDPEQEKQKRLDEAVDKIRDRYGKRALGRGGRNVQENPGTTD